jgi:hypothetical protein
MTATTTIEQLQADLAALPVEQAIDPRLKRHILDARITAARNETSTLAELDALIVDTTTWRDHLVEWRKTFCDELLALPKGDLRAQGLKLSIIQIDRGLDFWNEAFPARIPLDDLMAAAGYQPDGKTLAMSCGACWRGSPPVVEKRLRDLQKRRDDAQARLDAALRDD